MGGVIPPVSANRFTMSEPVVSTRDDAAEDTTKDYLNSLECTTEDYLKSVASFEKKRRVLLDAQKSSLYEEPNKSESKGIFDDLDKKKNQMDKEAAEAYELNLRKKEVI